VTAGAGTTAAGAGPAESGCRFHDLELSESSATQTQVQRLARCSPWCKNCSARARHRLRAAELLERCDSPERTLSRSSGCPRLASQSTAAKTARIIAPPEYGSRLVRKQLKKSRRNLEVIEIWVVLCGRPQQKVPRLALSGPSNLPRGSLLLPSAFPLPFFIPDRRPPRAAALGAHREVRTADAQSA